MRYLSLAPDFDGGPLEVEVAEPQTAELDAAQAEPFRDRDRHLVQQGVASLAGEFPQQRGLLDGDRAPVRIGPAWLAQPHRHVGRGVALLDQVAPQVPERTDRVLLRGASGATAFVAAPAGQDVLGDEVGQVTRRDLARVPVAVISDQAAGPGPVGVLGALGHQRQRVGLVQLNGVGQRHRRRDHGGVHRRRGVGAQAQELEDPAHRCRVPLTVGGGEHVEREPRVGERVAPAGRPDSLDHPDDGQQGPAELAQAGELGAGPPAQLHHGGGHRETTSQRRAKSSTGMTRIPPVSAANATTSNRLASATASQARAR